MRKASDIVAMRVMKCTSLTNFIVIVSGTSRPQNQAIANSIMVDVEEKHDGKRCLGNVSLLYRMEILQCIAKLIHHLSIGTTKRGYQKDLLTVDGYCWIMERSWSI